MVTTQSVDTIEIEHFCSFFFRIRTDNFKTYLFKRKNIGIRSESDREGAQEFATNDGRAIEQGKR